MAKLAPIFNNAQLIDGIPATGGLLFTYAADSATKQATFTDEAGTTPQSNPIVLNARGEPDSPIWLTEGLSYKFVFAPSDDTDPPSSAIRTFDDVSGINDASISVDQWLNSGLTPTYVNATQFTLPGDQTSAFQVNRRIKATVTAGTVYGYISVSAYTSLTTVTVVLDSGALDVGLSAVQYGILTPSNVSVPNNYPRKDTANTFSEQQSVPDDAYNATDWNENLEVPTKNAVRDEIESFKASLFANATTQATTTGTAITFSSIPAGTTVIYLMLDGVSTNGTNNLLLKLGDSGGVESTGYLSSAWSTSAGSGVNGTTAIPLTAGFSAASIIQGIVTLTLLEPSTNTWSISGSLGLSNAASMQISAGSKSLSAELTTIEITAGGNTFDAGQMNIKYK